MFNTEWTKETMSLGAYDESVEVTNGKKQITLVPAGASGRVYVRV